MRGPPTYSQLQILNGAFNLRSQQETPQRQRQNQHQISSGKKIFGDRRNSSTLDLSQDGRNTSQTNNQSSQKPNQDSFSIRVVMNQFKQSPAQKAVDNLNSGIFGKLKSPSQLSHYQENKIQNDKPNFNQTQPIQVSTPSHLRDFNRSQEIESPLRSNKLHNTLYQQMSFSNQKCASRTQSQNRKNESHLNFGDMNDQQSSINKFQEYKEQQDKENISDIKMKSKLSKFLTETSLNRKIVHQQDFQNSHSSMGEILNSDVSKPPSRLKEKVALVKQQMQQPLHVDLTDDQNTEQQQAKTKNLNQSQTSQYGIISQNSLSMTGDQFLNLHRDRSASREERLRIVNQMAHRHVISQKTVPQEKRKPSLVTKSRFEALEQRKQLAVKALIAAANETSSDKRTLKERRYEWDMQQADIVRARDGASISNMGSKFNQSNRSLSNFKNPCGSISSPLMFDMQQSHRGNMNSSYGNLSSPKNAEKSADELKAKVKGSSKKRFIPTTKGMFSRVGAPKPQKPNAPKFKVPQKK